MSTLASSGAFGLALPDSLIIYLDLDTNGLGLTPADVAEATLHVLGLSTLDHGGQQNQRATEDTDIYRTAQDYLRQFQSDDPSGQKALMLVAYVSTFFHEARHVHDLLSTGFGMNVLAAHHNYYQNALPLTAYLRNWQRDAADRRVPLPIRSQDVAMLGLDGRAVPIVERYTSLGERAEHFGAPQAGIYKWMSNFHLLEASAGVVQLDIIHDIFDESGLLLFDRVVRSGPAARKYMWLINDFMELVGQRTEARQKVGRMMAYLLWESLQGDRELSGGGQSDSLSAVSYFHAITDFVTRECRGNIELDSVRALVDRFNEVWGLTATSNVLLANQEHARTRADRFVNGWQAIHADAESFAEIFVSMRDAFLQMTQQIVEMPEIYFVGRFYAHAILMGIFPALRVDFKLGDAVHTRFTPGRPCLPPTIWDKAAFYSSILGVLINGRCSCSIPHIEQEAFDFLVKTVGLKFSDALFT